MNRNHFNALIFTLVIFMTLSAHGYAAGTQTILRGGSTNITWSVTNANSCSADTNYPALGDNVYNTWKSAGATASGYKTLSNVSAAGSFSFSCTNGAASDGVTLNVICPADSPYTETNATAIANYCGACPAGYHQPASLSCHSAPAWGPYGNSCTDPSCSGCGCIQNPAATGNISTTACTVASGASSCATTVTWSVQNTSWATVWDNVNATARMGSATGGSFGDTLSYGYTRYYTVRNGSASTDPWLADTSATPTCVTGTTWNGSVCAPPSSGTLTLSPTSCTIAVGASTCTVGATWTTSNASSPKLVDRNTGTTLSTAANASGFTVWVAYTQTVFDLKDGATALDAKTATASCAAGSTWDGSKCAPNSCNLPWGGTTPSGTSVTAYQSLSATSPSTCTSETRTCTNGTLSGSYNNQSCTQKYTITASAGANGSVTPAGVTTLNSGGSQTYTITPSSGYMIASLTVDGGAVTPVSSYTFSNVTANHTISATFTGASCSATYISWLTNCGGTAPSTTSGGSATVTNTASGYTGSATYSCSNGTWSGPTSASCTILLPDLTAGAVSPTTAVVGVAKTFSVTITNGGNASTGAAFSNFFQVATAANGGGTLTDLPSTSMATLAAGASAATAKSYTFNSPGTYSIRACADKTSSAGGGVINESDETNNCSGAWTTVTVVSPTGSLSLSPTSCTIAAGASTCSTVYATWATSNISSVNVIDRNTGAVLSTAYNQSSPGLQVWVAYPNTTFDLKNMDTATIMDTKIATATCAAGSTWNGSYCQLIATGTLTMPATCTIPSDSATCPTTVSWTTQNATNTITVERAYDPYGVIPGGTGTNGSTNVNFSPTGTYTLNLVHDGRILDSKTMTVTCQTNSNWNGSVCKPIPPQIINAVVSGNKTPNGTLSFECLYAKTYSIIRSEGATGTFPMLNKNYTGPVSVPLSVVGNYASSCLNSSGTSTKVLFYNNVALPPSNLSLSAMPKTINKSKGTTLSWSITEPSTSCSLRAVTVCEGGRSNCTQSDLAEEASVNQTLTNGTTDANDPYGPGRNIQTTLQTYAPENNPTGNKGMGKATLILNRSEDFILDCGSGLLKKVRVVVSDVNEG